MQWPEAAGKRSRTLPAAKALSLFERAMLQDSGEELVAEILKIKNAILTVMIVPPPCVRPAMVNDLGSQARGQDDLTRLLANIVIANTKLRDAIAAPTNIFGKTDAALLAELQWTVSSYMHNDIRGEKKATNRTGGTTRDLRTRLVGKNGRVRNTLMGKRVNFSARDVITPNVFIDVDQVGVPLCIAETLLKPDLVNALNFELMQTRLRNGIIKYVHISDESQPSVRRVLIDDRNVASIGSMLKVGWKVERTMLDDDYVCMNRHPSLHRMSMMGHRAKILPPGQLTFQMNPAVCPPYNADFDGDEMNLHLPTTWEAAAELQELLAVSKNVISPQNSRLSLGAVQDCALGIYLLSEPALLDSASVFQLVFSADGVLRPGLPHNGAGVISAFLQPDFCYTDDGNVRIVSGQLLSGRLARSQIHAILAATSMDYSRDVAVQLLGNLQRVACAYVSMRGFSITMNDCLMDAESDEAVVSFLDESLGQIDCSGASDSVKNGALGSLLGSLATIAGRKTGQTNAIVLMAASGAKGNSVNLTQIRCAVGQQNVNGARTQGTLPAFRPSDTSCSRFGFVRSSYSLGLTSTEFFHHAMSGREGIVDTAVKTAETGYLGRRLAKGFESVKTNCDQSVRNAFGEILQFRYGNDGYDTMWLERASLSAYLAPPEQDEDPRVSCYRALVIARQCTTVYIPCDVERLCFLAANAICQNPLENDEDNEKDDADEHNDRLDRLLDCLGGPGDYGSSMYQAAIVWCLRTKPFLRQVKSDAARRRLFRELLDRHCRALVSAGEMVGIVAAQSIAQPATQLTLNTFHYAGVASFNVTLGLPRLKELTDASSESLSPAMIIPLRSTASPKIALRSLRSRRLGPLLLREQLNCTANQLKQLIPHVNLASQLRYDIIVLDMALCVAEDISPSFVRSLLCPRNGLCSLPSSDTWWVALPHKPRADNYYAKFRICGSEAFDDITEAINQPSSAVSRFSPIASTTPQIVLTRGSCLLTLFGEASEEYFDLAGAYSNNLHETYACLGVEAAGNMLFSELRQVLSFEGTFVHDRHFQLIVDVMLQTGAIVPLSRHGLNKNMNTGILARASFEATVDQLLDGALRNETDYLRGVSENIFLGLLPPMGTGAFDTITVNQKKHNGTLVVQIPNAVSQPLAASIESPLIRIFQLANLLVPFSSAPFSCKLTTHVPGFLKNTPYRPSSPVDYMPDEVYQPEAHYQPEALDGSAIMQLYSDVYFLLDQ